MFYFHRDESISRCFWDTLRKSNDFTQTDRSPGEQNVCPSEEFKQTVQFKLADADFKEWSGNAELLNSLRQVIIEGVNKKCECGFNHHYISGEDVCKLMLSTLYTHRAFGGVINLLGK